MYSKYYHITT